MNSKKHTNCLRINQECQLNVCWKACGSRTFIVRMMDALKLSRNSAPVSLVDPSLLGRYLDIKVRVAKGMRAMAS